MSDQTECAGCYERPEDGHMFDCPTRIRVIERERNEAQAALEALVATTDLRAAPEKVKDMVAKVVRRMSTERTP